MTIFAKDVITPLYWAESSGFIVGRDSMGIQNSSVVLYSTLLPGITNLTQRIRYYGFYCWLLTQYDILNDEKPNPQHQYDFIRRAELTIAFYMFHKDSDYVAVPGKEFAGDFMEKLVTDGKIDISLGADKGKYLVDSKNTNRSYWKYSSGAMGQYYAGALLALSLIRQAENYYYLEPKGEALSNAYAESISDQSKSFILKMINSGILNYEDLEQLKDFDISSITEDSSERKTYMDILFKEDMKTRSTFQRKDTLLNYLKVSARDFPTSKWLLGDYFFQNPSEVNYDDFSSSLGWYIYYTQELTHFAIESIFNAMLLQMKKQVVEINEFIDEQVDLFEKTLLANKLSVKESLEGWISDQIGFAVSSPVAIKLELESKLKEAALGEVYYHAILLMAKTYQEVEDNISVFKNYLSKNKIQGRRGGISDLDRRINKNREQPINSFFRTLIKSILNDHQWVAFNKMGNGEAQVHKFLIEHNHLVHINKIEPRMTTPRLGSVKLILEDLNLLDKESHTPTNQGVAILEKYQVA